MSVQRLKIKRLFSTCRSPIAGKPRKIKQHGLVPCLHVVEEYFKYSASIDEHNHHHIGSVGLEDIWHAKNHHRQHLAGILHFCFIFGYLAIKYFSNPNLPHHQFKMEAANALMAYKTASLCDKQKIFENNKAILHKIECIGYSSDCFICRNGNGPNR